MYNPILLALFTEVVRVRKLTVAARVGHTHSREPHGGASISPGGNLGGASVRAVTYSAFANQIHPDGRQSSQENAL